MYFKELLPPPLSLCEEKIIEYPAVELWYYMLTGILPGHGVNQDVKYPLPLVVGVVERCETGKLRGA
jgi:hypothetical protein